MIGKTNAIPKSSKFVEISNDIITLTGSRTRADDVGTNAAVFITPDEPSLTGNANFPIKLKNGISYFRAYVDSNYPLYKFTLSANDRSAILNQLAPLIISEESFNVVVWIGYHVNASSGEGTFCNLLINPSVSTITGSLYAYGSSNTLRIVSINKSS